MSKKAVQKVVSRRAGRSAAKSKQPPAVTPAPVRAAILPEHLPAPMGLPPNLRLRPGRMLPAEMQAYLDTAIQGGKYMIAVWAVTDESTGTFNVKLLRNDFNYDYLLRARKTLDRLLLDIDPEGDPTQGRSVASPRTATLPATLPMAAAPAAVAQPATPPAAAT